LFALVDDDANLQSVESLIAHHADVNAYDPVTGSTPLLAALGDHAFAIARALITAGADVTARDRRTGATALLAMCDLLASDSPAADEEVEAMAEALLALGVDPTAARLDGSTLLHAAAEVGSRPLLRVAIAAGLPLDALPPGAPAPAAAGTDTNVEAVSEEDRFPPVCSAVLHPPTLAVLLAAGANAQTRTSAGHSPLALALRYRSAEAVRLLLEHGADPNAPLDIHATAETAAAAVAAADAAGAPLTDEPFVMPPALYVAVASGADDMTVEALLAAGASSDCRSYPGPHGEPALIAALRRGATAQVRALLAAGADANAVMITGTSAAGAGPVFTSEILSDQRTWTAASPTLPYGVVHTIPVTAAFAVAALSPAEVRPMLSLLRAHGANLDVFSVAGVPELQAFDAAAATRVDKSDKRRYDALGRAAEEALKAVVRSPTFVPPVVLFSMHKTPPNAAAPQPGAAVSETAELASTELGTAMAEVPVTVEHVHMHSEFDLRRTLSFKTQEETADLVMAFLDAGAAPDARGGVLAFTAATAAASAGNAALLAELLRRAPVLRELRSSDGATPLMRAVRAQSRAAITAAVANRVDATGMARGALTPLAVALIIGDAKLFDWLLNRLYVTAETRDAATVCAINALEHLNAATALDQQTLEQTVLPAIARVLGPYEQGKPATLGTANAAYVTALHYACERIAMPVLRALSSLGVPAFAQHPETGASALMSIVRGRQTAPVIEPGRVAAMHYVLAQLGEVNPHSTDARGLNAIDYAMQGCRMIETHGLLDAGVRPLPSALLIYAQSPPELAAAQDPAVVDGVLRRILETSEAALFFRTTDGLHATAAAEMLGNTAARDALRRLEYATQEERDVVGGAPAPALLDAAPALAAADVPVYNRLLRHVLSGDAGALTGAMQATVGLDLRTNTALAAGLLCAATYFNTGTVVAALIAFGADPAAVAGVEGEHLLHLAVRMRRRDAVFALAASKRVDIEARHRGRTPLLAAARAGYTDMVGPLVTSFGADAGARDDSGASAADLLVQLYAQQRAPAETVRALVDTLCARGATRPGHFDELVPAGVSVGVDN
jgi:ankyrin repeat protein